MDADEEESEYEYVYSTDETESYLVQLDLSTLNGIKRERPNRRDNANARQAKAAAAKSDDDSDDNDADDDSNSAQLAAATKPTSSSLQILDLNTENPIISHRGAFYSCTWHDLLGTDMFFTPPHQPALEASHAPLRTTNNYNLLGTSRVKLVGRRAKVSTKRTAASISNTANKKARLDGINSEAGRDGENGDEADVEDPKIVAVRAQTDFLERLRVVQETRQAREIAQAQAKAVEDNTEVLPE
jgi:hypothetical protein